MGRQLDTLWAAQLEQREPRCGTTAVRSWSTSCPHCISSSVWPPAPCWPGSRCSACSRYPAVSWRHAPSPPHLRHLPGPGQLVPAHPAAPGRLQAEVVVVRRVEARLGLAPGTVLGVAEVVAPPGHGAVPAVLYLSIALHCAVLCCTVTRGYTWPPHRPGSTRPRVPTRGWTRHCGRGVTRTICLVCSPAGWRLTNFFPHCGNQMYSHHISKTEI